MKTFIDSSEITFDKVTHLGKYILKYKFSPIPGLVLPWEDAEIEITHISDLSFSLRYKRKDGATGRESFYKNHDSWVLIPSNGWDL